MLVPLVRIEKEVHLVYIRRSQRLSNHAGQIAFPGGGEEEQDDSLLATALREGQEEVGIEPSEARLL
ncbi:MAG: NUDIX domain-containing protein, partial [Candidatus Eremiobacteraeota bacterium]|nr:NUDIX domain-containing protein [Candidatus Eremiobacteraeota bacterium]